MKLSVVRREFLKRAGQTLGFTVAGGALYRTFMGEILKGAMAQGGGNVPNYLHITMPAAPPRMLFDMLMTPHGPADGFIPGGFGTRFVAPGSGSAGNVTYSVDPYTVNGNTIYLPPVWSMSTTGLNFPDILPNTLFIRGMNMEINSHQLSNQRQNAPIIGGYSITGSVADASSLAVAGVADMNCGAAVAFRSFQGLAYTPINLAGKPTPLDAVIGPFNDFRQGRVQNDPARTPAQNNTLAAFETYASNAGMTSNNIGNLYENALNLMSENLGQTLGAKWTTTLANYTSIINEALNPTQGQFPGLMDKPITGAPTSNNNGVMSPYSFDNLSNTVVTAQDLRNIFPGNLTMPDLAIEFALAEILTGTITSSFTLNATNDTLTFLTGQTSGGPTSFGLAYDQHQVGSAVSTLATTFYFRAILGCITQLVNQMKANQIFNQSIIHVASEFQRAPHTDGTGADHAYMGSGTTLISGMINGGMCIGNIHQDGAAQTSPTYAGTWGVADTYALNRAIQVNDVALTLTTMLGVESVVTSGVNLLQESGGLWTPVNPEAKNNA